MKAQVGPVSLELKSIEDLHKFVTNQAPCVVGYFKDDSSSLKTSFLKIADKLREKLNFAHTSSESILNEKKIRYVHDVIAFLEKNREECKPLRALFFCQAPMCWK